MRVFLRERETQKKEFMDDPDCNKELLFNTYNQFRHINHYFSGWKSLYNRFIKPAALPSNDVLSILDIGCGACDILSSILKWADEDGIKIEVYGIDPDQRLCEYFTKHSLNKNIIYKPCSLQAIQSDSKKFDFVITNNIVHHLNQNELRYFFDNTKSICKNRIIFNDVSRSDLAWICYQFIARIFYRNSFALYDGSLSIKRAYTLNEMRQIAPNDWEVYHWFPFRLITTVKVNEKSI